MKFIHIIPGVDPANVGDDMRDKGSGIILCISNSFSECVGIVHFSAAPITHIHFYLIFTGLIIFI